MASRNALPSPKLARPQSPHPAKSTEDSSQDSAYSEHGYPPEKRRPSHLSSASSSNDKEDLADLICRLDLKIQNHILLEAQETGRSLQDDSIFTLIKVIGKGTYSSVYLAKVLPRDKSKKADQNQEEEKDGASSEGISTDEVVSQISEVIQVPVVETFGASPTDAEGCAEVALKTIQRPNFQKCDQTYFVQKMIFMNDAHVLQSVQGHPNIVKLVQIIPEGVVQTADHQKLHVDYAMAIECLKGGEMYYNMQKFGRYPPKVSHYFFSQVAGAIAHMHSRGFCHRDLKPWNIMLTDDLSAAKVIDFSYATPLGKDDFEHHIPVLKGFVPGTKYFMAPEQMDKNAYPLTDDFSKLDVWALGVLLINMLTLDFAFENPREAGREQHRAFVEDPEAFFKLHKVEFRSEKELSSLVALLRGCLKLDLKERWSIKDVVESEYVGHCAQPSLEEIGSFMQERLKRDRTLGSEQETASKQALPHYVHFSWNSTIIRHTPHPLNSILDGYREGIAWIFEQVLGEPKAFKIEHKKANSYMVSLHKTVGPTSRASSEFYFKAPLEANLVFSQEESGAVVCEILRRKGDYLTFIQFYCYVWNHFNRKVDP